MSKRSKDKTKQITHLSVPELSRLWREEGLAYIAAVEAYVEKGDREGWQNAGEAPIDPRTRLTDAVIEAVRTANRDGTVNELRTLFPPAQEPFIERLDEAGQSLPVVLMLDDGRIIARVGAPYEAGRMVMIDHGVVEPLDMELITVGRSRDRRYFALATANGISVCDGWYGPQVAFMSWPTGLEGMPDGHHEEPIVQPPAVIHMEPYAQGQRILLVLAEGIFVLTTDEAIRLEPSAEMLASQHADDPDEPLLVDLSMAHGAVSPDEKWLAVGHQCSEHLVFDSETLDLVADIGNMSEYPHYALFSDDGSMLALNSCHFYSGETIGVPVELLPGLETPSYRLDDRLTLLENSARVYAAVSRGDEFIIGDAGGYLRAFDMTGKPRWRHFIGSSIGAIDLSADGRKLVVTTYAGFLCTLDLDTGVRDPFVLGDSTHQEQDRWLFWKNEASPLRW